MRLFIGEFMAGRPTKYKKECLEQWIAFAQGRGIKVKVIADSPLCSETGLYVKRN